MGLGFESQRDHYIETKPTVNQVFTVGLVFLVARILAKIGFIWGLAVYLMFISEAEYLARLKASLFLMTILFFYQQKSEMSRLENSLMIYIHLHSHKAL